MITAISNYHTRKESGEGCLTHFLDSEGVRSLAIQIGGILVLFCFAAEQAEAT